MTSVTQDMHLGQALVAGEILTEQQLDQALTEQEKSGQTLAEILFEDDKVNTLQVLRILAGHLDVPYCQLRHGLIDFSLLELIGAEEADRFGAIPLFKVHDTLTVAMAQPQLLPNIDRLRELTGCKIRPVLAPGPNIREYIKKVSIGSSDIDSFLSSLSDSEVEVVEKESVDEGEATNLDQMVEGSPIVNLVNMAMLTAIRDKASDIHIEPEKNGTRIRYRIDGALRILMQPPVGLHAAIVSRVKVIGKMNIAEKRLPQEGRVRIVAEGRDIDLRVSSMPTLLGEKIVIRLLDKANLKARLQDLGFRDDTLAGLLRMLHKPYGLVLVTGPTGSGKTTTLYSALELLRSPERNMITVEDPVEYQLNLVNQIQVQESIGMSFARALRSILRQDPDIIMVGEIRDEETARVAVQASLTGHLVLATLHTNDAPGAVARLLDMGIEPYLLSSALNGVVAQRLARTVCPACVSKYMPPEGTLEDAGLSEQPGQVFRKGLGCKECHNSGFQGRAGIYSVMEVTDELRRLIHRAAPTHELQDSLSRLEVLTLRQEGVLLALDGKTSLEEVLSVTHCEEVGGEEEPNTREGGSEGGDLRATNRQLQEQIEQVESGFQTQISSLDATKRQLQDQIAELERYRDQHRQERSDLEQRLETQRGQLEEARETLQETAAESTTLKSTLQRQVSGLEHDNQRLQAQLTDVEQDQDRWRQERVELERRQEAESKDLRKTQDKLEQVTSRLQAEIDSLEDDRTELQQQTRLLGATLDEKRRDLEGVTQRTDALQAEHALRESALLAKVDALEVQTQTQQEERTELEGRMEASQIESRQRTSELEHRVNDLEAENSSIDRQHQTVQRDHAELEARLEERERALEQAHQRLTQADEAQCRREAAAQTQVAGMEAKSNQLQEQMAKLEQDLSDQERHLKTEGEEQEHAAADAQNRISDLESDNLRLTTQLGEVEQDRERYLEKVAGMEAKSNQLREQMAKLEQDLSERERHLKTEGEEQEHAAADAQNRISDLESDNLRLTTQLGEVELDRERYLEKVAGMEAKSNQLREQMAKLEQELSDRERHLKTEGEEQEHAAADAQNRLSDLKSDILRLTTQLGEVEQDRERYLEKAADLEQRLGILTATHQESTRTLEQITAGHERAESETRDQLQDLQSQNQQLQDQIGDLRQDRERLLAKTSDLGQQMGRLKAANQKSTDAIEQLQAEQEQAESDARHRMPSLQSHNQQLQEQRGGIEPHRTRVHQNGDTRERRLEQQAAEPAAADDRPEQTESDLKRLASERVAEDKKLEDQIRGDEQQHVRPEREYDAAGHDHPLQAQERVSLQETLDRRMAEHEQVASELRGQIPDLTAYRRPRPTRLAEPHRPPLDPPASTWRQGQARVSVQPDTRTEPAPRDLPSCQPVQRPRRSRRLTRPLKESYRSTGAVTTPDDRPHQDSGHRHLPHEQQRERAKLRPPETAERGLPMKGRSPQLSTVTKWRKT